MSTESFSRNNGTVEGSIVILNNTIEDLRKTILTLEEKLQERNSKQRSDS